MQIPNPNNKTYLNCSKFLPIFYSSNAQTYLICIHASSEISYRLDPIYEHCLEGIVININMNCKITVLSCCLKFYGDTI